MSNTPIKKSFFSNLGFWITIAMFLGIITGIMMGPAAKMFAPLGEIFMQLIKMTVIPLVFFSIMSGAISLGETKAAGKIGAATFAYIIITSMFAVALGIAVGEIFKPGLGISKESLQSMFSNQYAGQGQIGGFWDTIKAIIPSNPFKALIDGDILQIIFFSLFIGIAISTLEKEKKDFILTACNNISDGLIVAIMAIMYTAPIGVFALMADATGTFGYEILEKVLYLFILYVGALIIYTYGFYGLTIKLFSKYSVTDFFKKMQKPQLVALSTASSMATLPVNMETCEDEIGVSKETTSFVLPLGATVNMSGNAIYYAMATCFFAQLFGITLGMKEYMAIIFTATVGSIGQAGVPGPTLLVVAVLSAANVPLTGLPILFGVDRFFDMLRTVTNITGDTACAVIVDQFKDEK